MSYNEQETRFFLIDPVLRQKGYNDHQWLKLETPAPVEPTGPKGRRRRGPGRTDYLLCVQVGDMPKPLPVGVLEAKKASEDPLKGMQQAKGYADCQRFEVKFVFATNGHRYGEFDFFTNLQDGPFPFADFPPHPELTARYASATGIDITRPEAAMLFQADSPAWSQARYYQDAAIRAAFEKIIHCRQQAEPARVLLSLATGSGKTIIATNLLWRLGQAGQLPKPALFLCDRDELREQAYTKLKAAFGDNARIVKTEKGGNAARNARIHIATYQTLGLDDMLFDVAYAACYDDDDLRRLAQAFEAMQEQWRTAHARGIYRRLGDRDKYLELRTSHMAYGADYHDLASFYWEAGEKEKALQVAEEGLHKGKGRMEELRGFVATRAEEAGDRDKYMALQFEQATDDLTLESYRTFKKMCTAAEWRLFEPKILARLKDARGTERLKIRMHRKEYDDAVILLSKGRYPMADWDGNYPIQIAKQLETRYPEEILKYYLSGLGHLNANAQRNEYARKAMVMAKVRHLLVEVISDKVRWEKFAVKVKKDNLKRPAFQQEFADRVPGWRELVV